MNAENHDTFLQKNTKHSGRDALNIIYTDNKEIDNKAFQTHSSFNSKKKNCPQKEKEQEEDKNYISWMQMI